MIRGERGGGLRDCLSSIRHREVVTSEEGQDCSGDSIGCLHLFPFSDERFLHNLKRVPSASANVINL